MESSAPQRLDSDQFIFEPSSTWTAMGWVVLVGLFVSLMAGVSKFAAEQGVLPVRQCVSLILFGTIIWRRVLRPLPSRIRVNGPDLIIHDLPLFSVQANGINVPIAVRAETRIPVRSMVLEEISGTLVWNDMEHGRSIALAGGKQAKDLSAWLRTQGVSSPVGQEEAH